MRAHSIGVTAPPQRAAIHMIPCARTFSCGWSQVLKALVRFGKQPASPAPKRNWLIHSDVKLHIMVTDAVKQDHHSTIRISTLRAPSRSPIHPLGISASA